MLVGFAAALLRCGGAWLGVRRGYMGVEVEDAVPKGGPTLRLCGMMWVTVVCLARQVEP